LTRKTFVVLSLIGLLTSLLLWGMSYTVFGWSNGRTIISVSGGAFRYVKFLDQSAAESERWWSGFNGLDTALIPSVGWKPWATGSGGRQHVLLPFWIPSAFFATTLWFCYKTFHARRQRNKRGLCVHCGYNLTGNVSGMCPECGRKTGPNNAEV